MSKTTDGVECSACGMDGTDLLCANTGHPAEKCSCGTCRLLCLHCLDEEDDDDLEDEDEDDFEDYYDDIDEDDFDDDEEFDDDDD